MKRPAATACAVNASARPPGRRRPGRQYRRLFNGFLVPALLVFGLCGCGATVSVPPVENGLGAALVDHGRHTSLVVETANKVMVRYAYGDWRYFALVRQGSAETSRAALLPTAAGLGRRQWQGRLDRQTVAGKLPGKAEEILVFRVDRRSALDLVDYLDAIYLRNQESLHENTLYDLSFVHHPQKYTVFNNSNRKVAEWLEKLGCEVSGAALASDWEIGR